jgi:cell wall-associated NlpC family hydrolase
VHWQVGGLRPRCLERSLQTAWRDSGYASASLSLPNGYDSTAVYAVARMLCANGANLNPAVYAYNHSDTNVSEVLELAQTVAAGTAGGIDVDWALAQVGTPCISGGETPGVGLDCSGLVQAANKVATGFGSHDVASD